MQFVEFVEHTGQRRLIPHMTDQDGDGTAVRRERTGDDHAAQVVRQAVCDVTGYPNPIGGWFFQISGFLQDVCLTRWLPCARVHRTLLLMIVKAS